MKLLHLDSSISGTSSVSRQLTRELVEKLRARHPDLQVRYRDLGGEPLPHLSPEIHPARGADPSTLSDAQRREAAFSDELIAELNEADYVVIGAPLYNFSVPSALKAWIDRVAVAGKTFTYGPNGPVGLVRDKKTYLIATSGGQHSGSPVDQMHAGYLRTVLAFLGVTDVEVIRAEGLGISALREQSLASARRQIADVAQAGARAA